MPTYTEWQLNVRGVWHHCSGRSWKPEGGVLEHCKFCLWKVLFLLNIKNMEHVQKQHDHSYQRPQGWICPANVHCRMFGRIYWFGCNLKFKYVQVTFIMKYVHIPKNEWEVQYIAVKCFTSTLAARPTYWHWLRALRPNFMLGPWRIDRFHPNHDMNHCTTIVLGMCGRTVKKRKWSVAATRFWQSLVIVDSRVS